MGYKSTVLRRSYRKHGEMASDGAKSSVVDVLRMLVEDRRRSEEELVEELRREEQMTEEREHREET